MDKKEQVEKPLDKMIVLLDKMNDVVDKNNMDKLIEKHLVIVKPSDHANITKEIACGFAEWMSGLIQSNYKSGGNWYCGSDGKVRTTSELFDLYLKSLQK